MSNFSFPLQAVGLRSAHVICICVQFGAIDIDSELVAKTEVLEGSSDSVVTLANGEAANSSSSSKQAWPCAPCTMHACLHQRCKLSCVGGRGWRMASSLAQPSPAQPSARGSGDLSCRHPICTHSLQADGLLRAPTPGMHCQAQRLAG